MVSEPRKIVLILGNGFDIDLGLQTSYKKFWESDFCPKDYPAPLIKYLNQCWPENLDAVKWYDLENELLNYFLSRKDNPDYPDVVDQYEVQFLSIVKPELWHFGIYSKYIEQAKSLFKKGYITFDNSPLQNMRIPYHNDMLESSIWRDKQAIRLIKDGLRYYLDTLVRPEKFTSSIAYQVLAFLDEEAMKGDFVSIYSFNYTPLLVMSRTPDAAKVFYVHGSCKEGRIIVGTRDEQLLNEDYDFLQKSFDPAYNPPPLVEDLKNADEVVFFGHSIGENDRQYFKAFFKQQTEYLHQRRIDITIFTRDDSSETQVRRALQKMTDWNLSTLFGQNNLQIIKTGAIKEDQKKLFNFLIKHGKEEMATHEFIGKLLQTKVEE